MVTYLPQLNHLPVTIDDLGNPGLEVFLIFFLSDGFFRRLFLHIKRFHDHFGLFYSFGFFDKFGFPNLDHDDFWLDFFDVVRGDEAVNARGLSNVPPVRVGF